MSTSRTPDDMYDSSDLNDVPPWLHSQTTSPPPCRGKTLSPNTAALMSPAGSLTPAPLSRTKEGKPRVSDLNLLGLRGGAPQRPPTPPLNTPAAAKLMEGGNPQGPSQMQCKPKPHHDRVSALQSTPALPREIAVWRDEQRQEIDDARVRVHDVYVNDARAAARASAFVPPKLPDSSTRQPTRSMNNPYVDQTIKGIQIMQPLCSTNNALGQANVGVQIRKHLAEKPNQIRQQEEKQRQKDRQVVRQELFKPVLPSPFTSTSPPLPKPRQPIIHPQTPHCNVKQLSEAELDEKRRKLLTKKTKGIKEASDDKAKKKKKKKKYKNEDSGPLMELYKLSEHAAQESGRSYFVPEKPVAPATNKADGGGSYSKRKRRLVVKVPVGEVEDVSNTDDEIDKGYAPSGIYADDEIAKGYFPRVAHADDELSEGYAPNVANDDDELTKGYFPSVANAADEIPKGYAPSVTSVENHSHGHRYYGPGSIGYENEHDGSSTGAGKATSHTPRSHPPLIPRQTSQQTMCWNSDTAKRGLGFRSKHKRESDERVSTGSPRKDSPRQ